MTPLSHDAARSLAGEMAQALGRRDYSAADAARRVLLGHGYRVQQAAGNVTVINPTAFDPADSAKFWSATARA